MSRFRDDHYFDDKTDDKISDVLDFMFQSGPFSQKITIANEMDRAVHLKLIMKIEDSYLK